MKIDSVSGLALLSLQGREPCPLRPSNGFCHHTIWSLHIAHRIECHHGSGDVNSSQEKIANRGDLMYVIGTCAGREEMDHGA